MARGLNDDYRDRVAEFHHVVDKDFHKIGAWHLEFDLRKHRDICGVSGHVLKREFHFALSQLGRLIRSNEPAGLRELPHPCRPAIEQAKFERHDRQLWHANKIDDANEEEIPGNFLADFFTEQRALEVGENAGWVHYEQILLVTPISGWNLTHDM